MRKNETVEKTQQQFVDHKSVEQRVDEEGRGGELPLGSNLNKFDIFTATEPPGRNWG